MEAPCVEEQIHSCTRTVVQLQDCHWNSTFDVDDTKLVEKCEPDIKTSFQGNASNCGTLVPQERVGTTVWRSSTAALEIHIVFR